MLKFGTIANIVLVFIIFLKINFGFPVLDSKKLKYKLFEMSNLLLK